VHGWWSERLSSDFCLSVCPFAYRATRVLPHNCEVKKVDLALVCTKPLGRPAKPSKSDSEIIAGYQTNVSHHCLWPWIKMNLQPLVE
jgi:hypothetical protein